MFAMIFVAEEHQSLPNSEEDVGTF